MSVSPIGQRTVALAFVVSSVPAQAAGAPEELGLELVPYAKKLTAAVAQVLGRMP